MKALSFIGFLVVMTTPCLITTAIAESQASSDSIEYRSPSDAGQTPVYKLRLDLRKAMENVGDSELDELEAKFKEDSYYHMKLAAGDRNTIVPVSLAGMKRRPQHAEFVVALIMFSAEDQFTARGLDPVKRMEYYQFTFVYLQEALAIVQTSPKPDPNQKNSDNLMEIRAMLQNPMALAALEIGDLSLSKQISEDRIKANSRNDGDVIHEANTILGRVAMRQNDLESAKQCLLKSGKTQGSAVLKSYGPSFILARELLEKGQKEVVLEYLDLVAAFWGNSKEERPQFQRLAEEQARLRAKWIQEIKDGKIPADAQWLR